jgi:hypothetical protein
LRAVRPRQQVELDAGRTGARRAHAPARAAQRARGDELAQATQLARRELEGARGQARAQPQAERARPPR